MSIFSVTALIEPRLSSRRSMEERESFSPSADRKPSFSFYPPLYATPPQQRPPSPSSFSPSPYVLNRKGRWPSTVTISESGNQANDDEASVRVSAAGRNTSDGEGSEVPYAGVEQKAVHGCTARHMQSVSAMAGKQDVERGTAMAEKQAEGRVCNAMAELCGEALDGALTEDDKSLLISAGMEWRGEVGCRDLSDDFDGRSHASCQTSEEFYDALDGLPDGYSSEDGDGKAQASPASNQGMAASLQEELARRIKAEDTLASLQRRWNQMARRCLSIGLELKPGAGRRGDAADQAQGIIDPFEIISQKLVIARLVGGSVARAAIQVATEEEFESMLAAKNREISRLHDKLQYYELVNQEMSQRNQEIIEASQRRKQRCQKRQKLVLGCLGAALCVGTTGLVLYKLFPKPYAVEHSLPETIST